MDYTVSMHGWLKDEKYYPVYHPDTPNQDYAWYREDQFSFASGLNYYNPSTSSVPAEDSIELRIPSETLAKLAIDDVELDDMSKYSLFIWNGVDINLSQSKQLNQIIQPVFWRGQNIAFPSDGNTFSNYTWIYDDEKDRYIRSEAWKKKQLDNYSKFDFKANMNLHYYKNGKWNTINSTDINFDTIKSEYKLFFNSQYVVSVPNWWNNQDDAYHFQLSEDIIAVPSDNNATVVLDINIPQDGSHVELNSTIIIPGEDQSKAPVSKLKIKEFYDPLTNEWNKENAFRTSKVDNIWNFANGLYPILIEPTAYGSSFQEAFDRSQSVGNLVDNMIVDIRLNPELDPNIWNQTINQVDANNPVEPEKDNKKIATRINRRIRSSSLNPLLSPNDIYNTNSGPGVLWRNLNDDEQNPLIKLAQVDESFDYSVGASTFLHNDIVTPNKVYPGTPLTAPGGNPIFDPPGTEPGDNWMSPSIGTVSIKLNKVFKKMSSAREDKDWNLGGFYPHDSNGSDQRAIPYWSKVNWETGYGPSFGKTPDGFFAPATFVDTQNWNEPKWYRLDVNVTPSKFLGTQQLGAGNIYLRNGNPASGKKRSWLTAGGAGLGIHVDANYNGVISQGKVQQWSPLTNKGLYEKYNLLNKDWTGFYGEINYELRGKGKSKDKWQPFIKNFTAALKEAGIGQGPNDKYKQYAIDQGIPWVNHPKDMINIQNQIYKNIDSIIDTGGGDEFEVTDANYFGWNEVPVSLDFWSDISNFECTAFSLPTGKKIKQLANTSLLNANFKKSMLLALEGYEEKGFIEDGSTFLFAQSVQDKNGNYKMKFDLSPVTIEFSNGWQITDSGYFYT